MTRELLALDFYGDGITAALAEVDEQTDTLRIRHIVRRSSRSLSGALVRELTGAQDDLAHVLADMEEYLKGSVGVVVGMRGNFLSFRHRTGFSYTEARTQIIRESDIQNAIENSIPADLNEMLDVIDILPLSFSIDDQHGVINPRGMQGCSLEVETFISLAVRTHLANLNRVLRACGCEEYQLLPTSVALGSAVLTSAEKGAMTLVVDVGENSTSALLYHKDSILEGWELPLGLEMVAEEMSDLLQNDLPTVRKLLYRYEPDAVMDEVLEDSARPLVEALHKEWIQSLVYLQHQPTQLVLCGQGETPVLLKLLKEELGTRKARLATFDHLIADCDVDLPQYDGVLALLQHTFACEQQQLGITQGKEESFFGNILSKLGLNSLF